MKKLLTIIAAIVILSLLLASCVAPKKIDEKAHNYYLQTGRYLIKDRPSLTH